MAPEEQDQVADMALERSEFSPLELAVQFANERQYLVSEATVYCLLKAMTCLHQTLKCRILLEKLLPSRRPRDPDRGLRRIFKSPRHRFP